MTVSRLFLLAAGAAALSGCSAPKMEHVERGTVTVLVDPLPGKGIPVRVSAFSPKDGKRGPEINTCLVTADGTAGFDLPMGQTYEFRAFADVNRNGKQDAGEPEGKLEGISPDPNVHAVTPPVVLHLITPPPGTVIAPPEEPKKPAAAPVKPAVVGKKLKGKNGKPIPNTAPPPAAVPASTTPAPAAPKSNLPVPPPPPSSN